MTLFVHTCLPLIANIVIYECPLPFGIPVVPEDQKIIATSSSSIDPFCNNGGLLKLIPPFTNSKNQLIQESL